MGRGEQGEVKHGELPDAWQAFLSELKSSDEYQAFICRMFGSKEVTARFAWHVGVGGSEVSPHRDAGNKLGTHIFYFNTSEDWQPEWGGQTLALGGKKTAGMNPDFGDFATESASEIRDNHSFLFQNTLEAWHGVRTLTSPEGSYRRLFNVIFHDADELAAKPKNMVDRVRHLFRGK